jgi:hypothetical protein
MIHHLAALKAVWTTLLLALESVDRAQPAPEEHSREEGFKPRQLPYNTV